MWWDDLDVNYIWGEWYMRWMIYEVRFWREWMCEILMVNIDVLIMKQHTWYCIIQFSPFLFELMIYNDLNYNDL